MKYLIAAVMMIVTMNANAGLVTKAEVLEMVNEVAAEAQVELNNPLVIFKAMPTTAGMHGNTKSGRDAFIIDKAKFMKLGTKRQMGLIAHEVAHAAVHAEHGHTAKGRSDNAKHKSIFKDACKQITAAVGVSKNECSKSY